MNALRVIGRCATLFALALSTSGCIIGITLEAVSNATDQADAIQAAIDTHATVDVCVYSSSGGSYPDYSETSHVDCRYVRNGHEDTGPHSFIDLLSGVPTLDSLFDPIILQVPANATAFTGTMNGGGQHGNLQITEITGELRADAARSYVPEPGQKLVVIEFPAAITPSVHDALSFTLGFRIPGALQPVAVKALFAGKVAQGGTTFYPPLLPCETNFGNVDPVTLTPTAAGIAVDLSAAENQGGCNHAVYRMAGGGPRLVEVVEFYNAALDHYFITHAEDEIAALDAGTRIRGWARTGRTFWTYTGPQDGTSPVCRYYIPPPFGDSHFFGRGRIECDATGRAHPEFVLEDAAFMYLFMPLDDGSCPYGARPVYRAFDRRADANHRYMADRNVRAQMVAAGWLAEGDGNDLVVMCAPH
jgi:hypothetical protein